MKRRDLTRTAADDAFDAKLATFESLTLTRVSTVEDLRRFFGWWESTTGIRPRLRDARGAAADMLAMSTPITTAHVCDPLVMRFISSPGYVPNPHGLDSDSLTEGYAA